MLESSLSHLAKIEGWVPGVRVLRTYKHKWLPRDLVAGLVLCTMLIPQGMAYAELAELPPVTGLYTTIVCLLAYALFGPSPYLVLGPDSSLGPVIAAIFTRPLRWRWMNSIKKYNLITTLIPHQKTRSHRIQTDAYD